MKHLLRIEEFLQFALCAYLSHQLPFVPWLYWVLFLTPDIGMLGYLINAKTGAVLYNLFHHKGIGLLMYCLGLYLANDALQFTGLLLYRHSSFDRIFGYGLKYFDNFKHTHLGWLKPHEQSKIQ